MTTYLDHAATTPMRPEAVESMRPFFGEAFGNASGSHSIGRAARQAIDEARDLVADALGAQPKEVVFTGGGTESDNLAIIGAHDANPGAVISSAIEHHAVLNTVASLGGVFCPVDANGLIDLDALAPLLDDKVSVVSIMLVNNEVGTIQPLSQISRMINKLAPRAKFHTDAVQAVAWLDVAEAARFVDMVSISAHKFGGPQGVGALIVREGATLRAQSYGGGQERERRSGTQNVAGIVGMAKALELTIAEREATTARIQMLRNRLMDGLLAAIPTAFETVDRSVKVAGNAHLCLPGVESESLLIILDELGLCASAGASCASGALDPSHVLLAMGIEADVANNGLRLTLGRTTTDDDVDLALKVIPKAVGRLSQPHKPPLTLSGSK